MNDWKARLASGMVLLLVLTAPLLSSQPSAAAEEGWERSCTVHIVAVSSAGGGVLGNLTVTIRYPGEGRVFISTSPASMVDTQGSARIAAFAASLQAGVDMLQYDFYYEVRSDSIIIGGPSAGAAMALATLYLLENSTCPGDVVITGMIQPDTSIGPVGGLKEKLEAAAEGGARLFIVPAGQEVYTYYVTRYERIGPFVRVVREPVQVNLTEYGEQLGVRVETAATLAEAYALSRGGSPEFPGASLGVPDWLVPILEDYVVSVNATVASLLEGANTEVDYIAGLVANATSLMNTSLELLGQGRVYPAAVDAVLAEAYARTASIVTHALENDLNVTVYVLEANTTIIGAWNATEQAASTANGSIRLDAAIKAYAKLGLATYYYQAALMSLAEDEDGNYYLPRRLLGVDPTGAELLGLSTAVARWAWFWANTTTSIPAGEPYSRDRLVEVSRLLLAEAKTTVAYVQTLLEEAGADAGRARLAAYLADQAMAARDPVAVIGYSIESIAESTRAIHESFTLDPEATASQLASIAARLAAESKPYGVQGVLSAIISQEANSTMERLLAASRSILYSWTILEIAKPTGEPPIGQQPGEATTTTTTTTQVEEPATTTTQPATATSTRGGEPYPETGQGAGTTLAILFVSILALLAGAAVGQASRR